uniref:C-type lectin domain-containing protein n=1 Tax=Salarias fasciatus TaxID=181472 RepID=A0A672FV55_SALFA
MGVAAHQGEVSTDSAGCSDNCVQKVCDGWGVDGLVIIGLRKPQRQVSRSSVTPRFFLMDMKLSKSNAQRHCRRNFTDLASVTNEAENEELKSLTAGVGHWISLFRAPWKWPDESHMSFSKWNATLEEPNGGIQTPCVTVRRGAAAWIWSRVLPSGWPTAWAPLWWSGSTPDARRWFATC